MRSDDRKIADLSFFLCPHFAVENHFPTEKSEKPCYEGPESGGSVRRAQGPTRTTLTQTGRFKG